MGQVDDDFGWFPSSSSFQFNSNKSAPKVSPHLTTVRALEPLFL